MSEDFRYELEGDGAIEELMNKFSPPSFLNGVMQRIGARITAWLKKYPAPPPNSTYRRTGNLGRRWTSRTSVALFSATAIIGNNTPYGPEVQGEGFQADIHVGRWQTDEQALAAHADVVEEEVGDAIDRLIG